MTNSRRNKIAPVSIFFLLYISRIVNAMTNIQSVTAGLMKTDTVISILISMGVTLAVCVPAIVCIRKKKNPMDVKFVGFFYSIYFIFLAAVYISRFAYFASTTLNPDSQSWIFVSIVAVCAMYGSLLGIEGISRFSGFAFFLLIGAILLALGFSIDKFDEVNFYPVISNSTEQIIRNVGLMTSSTGEIAIFLCLSKKVNGSAIKPFVWSLTGAFFTIFVLFLFVVATMGDGAALQAFPLYSFFQHAKIGLFDRFDVLYSSFWIMGIFIKSVIYIYCASTAFKPMKSKTKCIASSAAVFAVSIFISQFTESGMVPPAVYAVPFAVFCIIIPLLTLIFKKRNYGDELVESF